MARFPNQPGIDLTAALTVAAVLAFTSTSARAESLEGGVSRNVDVSDAVESESEEIAIAIPQELYYQLWPGYVDALIKAMAAESIENTPLMASAELNRSINPDELGTLEFSRNTLTSDNGQDCDNLVTSASDETTYSNGLGLITSDEGRLPDDSYIISTTGTHMIEALSVCAAPALSSAFTSLPSCSCSVKPIEAADHISVLEGTALIVADRDMEIAINVGKLKIAEGSVVLISTTPKGTAVFDFHDTGKNSVLLTVAGRSLAISPGRHLHATSEKTTDFAAVNSLDRIAHRRVSCVTTDGGTVFTSEFSTLSAMEAVEPLKKVLTLRHPEARKLANQIIKTSAVLMQLGGNSDDFKHHFKPKATALVNGTAI